MRYTTNTQQLREALTRLAHIPGAGGPTSGTIQVASDMEGIALTRSTPEAFITILVEATVEEEGEHYCDYAEFLNLLREMPDRLVFRTDPKWVHISGGHTTAKLAALDAGYFSSPEKPEKGTSISLPLEDLRKAIGRVIKASAKEGTQVELEGISIRTHFDKLCLVCADGKRAHVAEIAPVGLEVEALIPLAAVLAIERLAGGDSGKARLTIGENSVHLRASSIELRSALTKASYPNMEQFFSFAKDRTTGHVKLERVPLIEALKSAGATGEGDLHIVQLRFIGESYIVSGDKGVAGKEIKLPTRSKFLGDFKVSSGYFRDLLAAAEEEEIDLQVGPTLIHFSEAEYAGALALIVGQPK